MKTESLTDPLNTSFDEWWNENKITSEVPVLELAYKEIAFKGWTAAVEKLQVRIIELEESLIRLRELNNKPHPSSPGWSGGDDGYHGGFGGHGY